MTPRLPRGALTPDETFIPLGAGTGLATRPFGHGDTLGKQDIALASAVKERALLKPGSPRDRLYALQEATVHGLRDGSVKPMDFPLQHLFPPGLYLRTIFLPRGSHLVGKIHKHRHGNILSIGAVRVFTESGGQEDFRGPLQMVSEPGTKRAVFALTDAVWTTIHLNPKNTQDLAELEADIIASTYEEYEAFLKESL